MSGVGVEEQNKIAEPEIFPNDVGPPEAHDHPNPRPERRWQCLGVIPVTLLHSTGRQGSKKARTRENKTHIQNLKSGSHHFGLISF